MKHLGWTSSESALPEASADAVRGGILVGALLAIALAIGLAVVWQFMPSLREGAAEQRALPSD